jgi:hypothetical protein
MISVSVCGTRRFPVYPKHTFGSSAQGFIHNLGKRAISISEGANQHRQTYPGHCFNLARGDQAGHDIAWRTAANVREQQDALARINLMRQATRPLEQSIRIVIDIDRQRTHTFERLAQDLCGGIDESIAEITVGNDQNANHFEYVELLA